MRPVHDVVSVWLGALDGTTWWEVDADEPVYAASLVKVPLATAAERRHRRGELDLDAAVPVHPEFDSVCPGARFTVAEADDQDPPTWAELGGTQTLRELRRRAVVHSGNLASALLVEHVGLAEVAAVLADAGCGPATAIARWIGDRPAAEAGLDNVVTARDLGRLLAATPAAVEEVMLGQTHRDGIAAGLPPGAAVASKSGWVDDHTHDMALVRPGDGPPFALVVLTRLAGVPVEEGRRRVAALAAEAWERRRVSPVAPA